jgi:hypothetical protein
MGKIVGMLNCRVLTIDTTDFWFIDKLKQ